MKGKAILTVIIAGSLLFSGCNSENRWEEALGQSAPPDPYKQAQGKVINEEKKKQERQKIELAETATGQKTVHKAQYRPDLDKKDQVDQRASLLIILESADSCYQGDIRPYIDGILLGRFDKDGKLEVKVAPGTKELSIFDAVSVRRIPVTLTAGKRQVLTVKCEGRVQLPAEG